MCCTTWIVRGHEEVLAGKMLGSPKVKQFRIDRPMRGHARGAGAHGGGSPTTGSSHCDQSRADETAPRPHSSKIGGSLTTVVSQPARALFLQHADGLRPGGRAAKGVGAQLPASTSAATHPSALIPTRNSASPVRRYDSSQILVSMGERFTGTRSPRSSALAGADRIFDSGSATGTVGITGAT
jgi:hypothetical protein